jgi:hypothetical protein
MHPERDAKSREANEPLPNHALDEFFVKINRGLRRPKPSEQEVAQAIGAIHSLTQQTALKESALQGGLVRPGLCSNCRAANNPRNRFCGYCGTRLEAPPPVAPAAERLTAEQHIQHYHHFPQAPQKVSRDSSPPWTSESNGERADLDLNREQAILQLVANWSRFFN